MIETAIPEAKAGVGLLKDHIQQTLSSWRQEGLPVLEKEAEI